MKPFYKDRIFTAGERVREQAKLDLHASNYGMGTTRLLAEMDAMKHITPNMHFTFQKGKWIKREGGSRMPQSWRKRSKQSLAREIEVLKSNYGILTQERDESIISLRDRLQVSDRALRSEQNMRKAVEDQLADAMKRRLQADDQVKAVLAVLVERDKQLESERYARDYWERAYKELAPPTTLTPKEPAK